MKWKNKRKELDEQANILLREVDVTKGIYIWGAGILGKELGSLLKKYNVLKGFIDNDMMKQNTIYCGAPVISLKQYSSLPEAGIIVLAVGKKNKDEIILQLKKANYTYGRDFYEYLHFINYIFPIISVYYFQKSFIPLAQISLTERCTLKCRKCAHACYNVSMNQPDLDIQYIYHTADIFFSKIDYIQEFVLIGGEPLLYKQLPQVINYIGGKYRKQINIFSITTNGTLLPTAEIIEASKSFDVLYRISNYSEQLPYLVEKYNKLRKLLKENNIKYKIGQAEQKWMDYGFEYVNREGGEEELIKTFDRCKTSCREIRGSRLYFCVMARSVSENLGYEIGQDDYLELDNLQGKNWKKELLEFNIGYSEKGYLDMCVHCHGKEAYNYLIPAAEQIEV